MAKRKTVEQDSSGWITVERGRIIDWEQGMKVQGVYVQQVATPGMYGKPGCLLKLRVGEQVQTYGCPAQLRGALENVMPGEEIRVICNGKHKNEKGNNEWQFNVARRGASA